MLYRIAKLNENFFIFLPSSTTSQKHFKRKIGVDRIVKMDFINLFNSFKEKIFSTRQSYYIKSRSGAFGRNS